MPACECFISTKAQANYLFTRFCRTMLPLPGAAALAMSSTLPAMNTVDRGEADRIGHWNRRKADHCPTRSGCVTCGKAFGAMIFRKFSVQTTRMLCLGLGAWRFLRPNLRKKI